MVFVSDDDEGVNSEALFTVGEKREVVREVVEEDDEAEDEEDDVG